MSSTSAPPAPPLRLNHLLDKAHADIADLQQLSQLLQARGIVKEDLPDELDLQAFAWLADRDRRQLTSALMPFWPMLLARGVVRGDLQACSTPKLRLLSHAKHLVQSTAELEQRVLLGVAAPATNSSIICVNQVNGAWGQLASIHFELNDCDHFAVSADPIFCMNTALIPCNADTGRFVGSFDIPIDNGQARIRALQKASGEVLEHVITFRISHGARSTP